METKTFFEKKIKPLILYIGIIGAIVSSIAYIALVVIFIVGFKKQELKQTLVYAVVNAIVGLIIANFLKYQGIAFAENIPENKQIKDDYFKKALKEKKYKNLIYFWTKTIIVDILIKGLSLVITTTGIIYIVINGTNDYSLLLLAFFNLLMFISFGLLSLNKAYNYYNDIYVNFMKKELEKRRIINDNNSQRREDFSIKKS